MNAPLRLIELLADVNVSDKSDKSNKSDDSNGGTTPIMKASMCGLLDVVQCLVSSGADMNQANKDGDTPLCCAIWCYDEDDDIVLAF